MTVDKRINYFKGGGYQGGTNTSDRRTGGQGTQVSRNERPSRKTVPSGNTGSNDRQSYNVNKSTVDVGGGKARKLNARDYALLTRNNYNRSGFGGANRIGGAGRFADEYTGGGLKDLFKGLLSFKVPGASFLFNKGKQGISGINNVLNDFTRNMRKGFDTQEEYEIDRQKKIDDNTIRTLENTIQKKYLDKNRSLDETQLDEKLAALKQKLGIMQNVKDDIKTIPIANPEIFDNIPMNVNDERASIENLFPSFDDEYANTFDDQVNLTNTRPTGASGITTLLDELAPPDDNRVLPKDLDLGNNKLLMSRNNMGKDFFDASSLFDGSGITGASSNNKQLAGSFKTKTQKLLEDMANSGEIELPGTASASEVEQTPVNIEATNAQIEKIKNFKKIMAERGIQLEEGDAETFKGTSIGDELSEDVINSILGSLK